MNEKKQASLGNLFLAMRNFEDDEPDRYAEEHIDEQWFQKLIPEYECHCQNIKSTLRDFGGCRNFIFWIPDTRQLKHNEGCQ